MALNLGLHLWDISQQGLVVCPHFSGWFWSCELHLWALLRSMEPESRFPLWVCTRAAEQGSEFGLVVLGIPPVPLREVCASQGGKHPLGLLCALLAHAPIRPSPSLCHPSFPLGAPPRLWSLPSLSPCPALPRNPQLSMEGPRLQSLNSACRFVPGLAEGRGRPGAWEGCPAPSVSPRRCCGNADRPPARRIRAPKRPPGAIKEGVLTRGWT